MVKTKKGLTVQPELSVSCGSKFATVRLPVRTWRPEGPWGGEGAVGPASSCAEVPVVPPADVEEPLVAAVEPERRIHCRERVRGQGCGVRKPVAADGRTPRRRRQPHTPGSKSQIKVNSRGKGKHNLLTSISKGFRKGTKLNLWPNFTSLGLMFVNPEFSVSTRFDHSPQGRAVQENRKTGSLKENVGQKSPFKGGTGRSDRGGLSPLLTPIHWATGIPVQSCMGGGRDSTPVLSTAARENEITEFKMS